MRFSINQPAHTDNRALVPLLFFIVGVWGTVLVYALCCRRRKAAAAAAAAAAAPGSPAAAAAAALPPPPGTPTSSPVAPSPLRAPPGEAHHFARALQLPAASLLDASPRLQAPARRDGLLLEALARALRVRAAACGAHAPVHLDALARHASAYREALLAGLRGGFWGASADAAAVAAAAQGTNPHLPAFLRLARAWREALAQHLLEAEDPRDPAGAALAALPPPPPAAPASQHLRVPGADRLELYAAPSLLHDALAAGLPVLATLNVFPSLFAAARQAACARVDAQAARHFPWLAAARLPIVPALGAPLRGQAHAGPLGSHTFLLTALVRVAAGEGGGEAGGEGAWQWCALARDGWCGEGPGAGAGRHASGAWLLSAELLAHEKSFTRLYAVDSPVEGLA